MDTTNDQRATEYSEANCFELYCANGGKIGDMERYIAGLPPENRVGYPSRATLYRYENDFQWRERYAKIRAGIKQELESEVGMPLLHVTRIAALVMAGTTKRLHQAYEAGNYEVFTPRLLDTVWKMQRVERGLASNVPFEHQKRTEDDSYEIQYASPERMQYLIGKVRNMSQEDLRTMAQLLNVDEPPAILRKRVE
ncbi:MAG: hypothetical protein WC353_03020 [Candidatus Peribacter sp.]